MTAVHPSGGAAEARRLPAAARLLVLLVALATLGGTAGCGLFGGSDVKHLTAHFARTVGLYQNSDVRILGVKVGKVTAIKPEGTTVRVEMEYDAKYKLPSDAKAVVVSPSIVSDRYVQIIPVWRGGDALPASYDLPADRTAVPVELDQIYSSLDQLNQAIGPNGANKHGALADLLHVGARNLSGNGALLNSTLTNLSQAIGTLATSRSDLFSTVDNLQSFTTTLARSDQTVRQFNSDLAQVAAELSGERQQLGTAVRELSLALGDVATFIRSNKTNLTANVTDLASVTSVLVKQKRALEEFIDNSGVALSNLQLAYNPKSGTLDTRDDSNSGTTPTSVVCGLFKAAGQACPSGLPPLPVVPVKPSLGSDPTLGGILGGAR